MDVVVIINNVVSHGMTVWFANKQKCNGYYFTMLVLVHS